MKPLLSLPAVVFGAALAVTSPTAPAPAAPSASTPATTCRSVPLPVPDDGVTMMVGGDPTGRYLLGDNIRLDPTTDDYEYTPVMWTGGRLQVLDKSPIQPAIQVILQDANRHGVVVGERMTDHGSFHTDAFVYRAGRYTWLPPLSPGDQTRAVGINDRGDVVGYDEGPRPSGEYAQYHAVVWPADRPGTVRELSLPGEEATDFSGLGIDEDGTVIGIRGVPPVADPYVWPAHGTPYQLTAPAGTDTPVVTAIRDGWVVGHAYVGYDPVGVRWNLRTGRSEVLSTAYPSFQAVNARGDVAAVAALIHRDGRAVPLDQTGSAYPVVITDSGVVAGNPYQYDGPATLWFGC